MRRRRSILLCHLLLAGAHATAGGPATVPDERVAGAFEAALGEDFATARAELARLAELRLEPAARSDAEFAAALTDLWTRGLAGAIESARRSLALARKAGDRKRAARAGGLAAFLMLEQGRSLGETLPLALLAEADARSSHDHVGLALALSARAAASGAEGDVTRCLAQRFEALAEARQAGHAMLVSVTAAVLADDVSTLGDLDAASRYAIEAVEVARQAGLERTAGSAAIDAAWILADQGRPEEALELLRPTVAMWRVLVARDSGLGWQLAWSAAGMAFALAEAGRNAEAEALYLEVSRMPDLEPLLRDQVQIGLAALAATRGDVEAARLRCQTAQETASPWLGVQVLAECGAIEARLGSPGRGMEMLRESWRRLELLDRTTPTAELSRPLRWLVRRVSDPLVELLLAQVDDPAALREAFLVIDATRGRALQRLLKGPGGWRVEEWPEPLRTEGRDALRRRNAAEAELRDPGTTSGRRDELVAEVSRAMEVLEALGVRSRAMQDATPHPRHGLEEVAASLPDGAVLVAYYQHWGEGPAAAFVLERDGALQAVPLGRAQDVRRLGRELVVTGPSISVAGERLLEPVAGALGGLPRRLVIVPGPVLWQVPFDALPVDGLPLLESSTVSVVPSAQVLVELASARRPAATADLLALADPATAGPAALLRGQRAFEGVELRPLPHARREAVDAARLFRRTSVLVGTAATESSLRRLDRGHTSVVHIATHGIIRPAAPDRSAILLSPEGEHDGLLQPYEIRQLRLNVELVVLSGCETAVELAGSRGDLAMGRSFLAAGARAFVGTLWRVPDRPTADLMARFYAELAARQPVDEALRRAKLALYRSGTPASDWASFVLVGRPGLQLEMQVSMLVRARPWLAACGSVLAAALVAAWVWRARRGRRVV